ncbi:MAG: hypothetical protein ACOCZD_00140, partial [Haloferacaceae archaeon]
SRVAHIAEAAGDADDVGWVGHDRTDSRGVLIRSGPTRGDVKLRTGRSVFRMPCVRIQPLWRLY